MKRITRMRFKSQMFECSQCGYYIPMLVRWDTATCPRCGGTMYRNS